jgi:hypothetical protein
VLLGDVYAVSRVMYWGPFEPPASKRRQYASVPGLALGSEYASNRPVLEASLMSCKWPV